MALSPERLLSLAVQLFESVKVKINVNLIDMVVLRMSKQTECFGRT